MFSTGMFFIAGDPELLATVMIARAVINEKQYMLSIGIW